MSQTVTTIDDWYKESNKSGYFLLRKEADVMNDETASLEGKQGHGFKKVVFASGSTHKVIKWSNAYRTYEQGELKGVASFTDLLTALTSGVNNSSVYTLGIGDSFLPEDGEDILVNIDGLHVIRSNPLGYSMEIYDADFTNLLTQVSLTTATGDLIVSGAVGQNINLKIGENTQIHIVDGKITLSGAEINISIADLYIGGNLVVSGTTNTIGQLTNNAKIQTTTIESSGNASLHAGRVDTGA